MKYLKHSLWLALLVALPVHATTIFVETHANTACGGVTSCTVTGFSAVPAGSLIIASEYNDGSGKTIVASAGTSGGGTWVVPSGCTTNADCHAIDATAGAAAVQYILSSTGSPTSLSCTATAASILECQISVYTYTGASMSFDVGAVRDQSTAAANVAGVSAGTLTGTNDVIYQFGIFAGAASGCPNSSASPAAFPNSNGACGLVNSTNAAAGTYTSSSGRAGLGAIAFKEAAAAGGSNGFNKQRRYDLQEGSL